MLTVELINKIKTTASSNEKLELLKQAPEAMRNILKWTYDDRKYFIANMEPTSGAMKIAKSILDEKESQDRLELLLKNLAERVVTGNSARDLVAKMLWNFGLAEQEIIIGILNKDQSIGIGKKQIMKIFPDLLGGMSKFQVPLANKFRDKFKKVTYDGNWLCSTKLNGLRCIAKCVSDGEKIIDVEFWSRQAKKFKTLKVLRQAIIDKEIYSKENFYFDGELCKVDKNMNESFKGILKEFNKDDYDMPDPHYLIFDTISKTAFEAGIGTKADGTFSERYENIIKLLIGRPVKVPLNKTQNKLTVNKFISIVGQEPIISEEQLSELVALGKSKNWEGLMLRKDALYKAGRIDDILKVKAFQDAEFVVQDIIIEELNYNIAGKGIEKIKCMKSAIIPYKGNTVRVGSGFTKEERIDFMNNPEKIVGKRITVQFFEETFDSKTNLPSLQFPTFVCVREGGF